MNTNLRTELRMKAINLVLAYRSVLSSEEFTSAMGNAASVYPHKTEGDASLEDIIFSSTVQGGISEVVKRFELDSLKKRILTDDSIPVPIRVFYCDNVIVGDVDTQSVLEDLKQFMSSKR